jgi:uncharacterized protein YcnI
MSVARPRPKSTALAIAVVGTLLVAGPAAAHPSVQGGELPVDSLATMTLAMAHGCESETSGDGDPTTEVSLEVPDWLRVVEVADEEGWSVELEQDDSSRTQVVTWTADGAEEPAPDFVLDVVATGEPGDERYLSVFQACDDFVYRWVGTPEDPADDPAIGVTLTAADEDSPPPPEPEPQPETGPEPEPTEEPEPEATEDAEPEAAADTEPAADADDGGLPGWLIPVTVVAFIGGLGLLLLARRGRSEA